MGTRPEPGRSGRKSGQERALTVTVLWLTGPMKPVAAWRLLATLRSATGIGLVPAAFRTEIGSTARKLGRRADALVIERFSMGATVELVRRGGQSPRTLLRSGLVAGAQLLTFYGLPLKSLADVMAFVDFSKQLYDVLHPEAGVVDIIRGSEADIVGGKRASHVVDLALQREGEVPAAWLTLLGPERVDRIGALRLLMAPVFLIEMLPDGGLLVADTPLPRESGRGAGGRSPVLSDYLHGEGVFSSGAPVWVESVPRFRESSRQDLSEPVRVSEP